VEGGAAGSGLEGRGECRAADGGASESWGPSSIVCTGTSVLWKKGKSTPRNLFGDFHPSHIQEYAGGLLFALEKPAKDGGGIRAMICDDSYIKAKLSVALEVLSDIKHVLKEDAGLVLNFDKTKILVKGISAADAHAAAQRMLAADPSLASVPAFSRILCS
jgi:hypothetical protein